MTDIENRLHARIRAACEGHYHYQAARQEPNGDFVEGYDLELDMRAVAELTRLREALEDYRNALRSIATYDQDERPLEAIPNDPFDWRRRSMKQEGIARAALDAKED